MYLTKRMQDLLRRMSNGKLAWQNDRGLWTTPGDEIHCQFHSLTVHACMHAGLLGEYPSTRQRFVQLTEQGEQIVALLEPLWQA